MKPKEKRQREDDSMRILVMDVVGEWRIRHKEAAKIIDVAYPIRIMSISATLLSLTGRRRYSPGRNIEYSAPARYD